MCLLTDINYEESHLIETSVCLQALVGYRDYGDTSPVESIDFVEKETFGEMQEFIRHLVAKGGDDWAEDVAGGLQVSHWMPGDNIKNSLP